MDLNKRIQEAPYHRWLGVELLRADAGDVEVRASLSVKSSSPLMTAPTSMAASYPRWRI